MNDFEIYCPSIRRNFYKGLAKAVHPLEVIYKDGHGYNSYSQLINNIISECKTEIVIVSNDKARPTEYNVYKLLKLLEKGFGFVGLYRLGFFGFRKDLIKKIGFFDERFRTAGYEDIDFYLRLKLNNIASYITEEIRYIDNIRTIWDHKESKKFFYKKYTINKKEKTIYKNIEEETYDYHIDSISDIEYLDWTYSILRNIFFLKRSKDFCSTLKEYSIKLNY